jgi:hypothetical protein
MEVTAPQIKNGIPSKREWNPLPKVSSIGARSHHTEPRFCVFGRTDISYCNGAHVWFGGVTASAGINRHVVGDERAEQPTRLRV